MSARTPIVLLFMFSCLLMARLRESGAPKRDAAFFRHCNVRIEPVDLRASSRTKEDRKRGALRAQSHGLRPTYAFGIWSRYRRSAYSRNEREAPSRATRSLAHSMGAFTPW